MPGQISNIKSHIILFSVIFILCFIFLILFTQSLVFKIFTSVVDYAVIDYLFFTSAVLYYSTLKDEEDAVVDKLVTDDKDSKEPFFLRLDSEP